MESSAASGYRMGRRGRTYEKAYAVLRSVLHALRDCLPPAEVVKFSAQMPMMVKGVFFDGWKITPKPLGLTRPFGE